MAELPTNKSDYFRPLTGVRAIAAFMVFFHHFNPFPEKYFGIRVFDFVQEFHIGVSLFFVLSGFLIAYRYSEMSYFSFRNYMVNRIARIYPMYFILTSLTFILFGILQSQYSLQDLYRYLCNISFLKGFFEEFKFTGIAQGWSLTVEETFYILAPLIFLLLKRSKIYLLGIPVVLMSFGIGLVLIFSRINFHGFFISNEFMFNYTFFGRCFEFFIGISLAIIFKHKLFKTRFRYFTYAGIGGIILSIFLITLFKGNFDTGIRHPMGKVVNSFILPVFGVSMFYYGLLTENTLISRILGSGLFVLLGKSSYIFYLIHLGVFSLLLHKITNNYILIFLALNIISILLFKFIEEPLNLYLRKKWIRKPLPAEGIPLNHK